MTEANTRLEKSRFFLTGSDFSELAVLENTMTNEINSMSRLEQLVLQDNGIKTAKFKRIDWNQMEMNLIKQPIVKSHRSP